MDKDRNQIKIIKAKYLIDGKGKDAIKDGVIVIENGKIKEVGRIGEVKEKSGAEILEMDGCTIMPGLMDIHIHIAAHNIMTFKNHRVADVEISPQLQMIYALLHAQICFEMGFTTLRSHPYHNLWTPYDTAELVAVRDAINLGIVPGPRILAGGKAHITSSHFDVNIPRSALRLPGSTANGPWALREMARTQLRIGCDHIKTVASGGGGTDKEEPDIRNMTQEELDAIVDEAHAFHKHCACHCFTPTAQKMAVKAGVDTIEHCVFTDKEAISMMKNEGKIIVPTLAHRSDHAIEVRRKAGSSDFVLNKMKRIQPTTKETFQRLYQAGIKIALGTDTQVDPEMGTSALELEIYVDYGMTPMEAIKTGTINAAEAIWLDKFTGSLEVGKWADLIVINGNPLEDIRILQEKNKILIVMKEGKIYIDRRIGHEKYVIFNQERDWEKPV